MNAAESLVVMDLNETQRLSDSINNVWSFELMLFQCEAVADSR